MAFLTDKYQMNGHIEQSGPLKNDMMHGGKRGMTPHFNVEGARQLVLCRGPLGERRDGTISPAVICASDQRGGHFYSCYIVGTKQDVACGAAAVCISVCVCVVVSLFMKGRH